MASISETGHAVNVDNFGALITGIKGLGPRYNPATDNLKVASLESLYNAAPGVLTKVKTGKTDFDTATNLRQQRFDPLPSLATSVFNAFSICGASKEAIADMKTVNKKIQGTRAKRKDVSPSDSEATPPAPKTVSASQQSFTMLADNFEKMIVICESEPQYKPNESDITVSALRSYHQSLLDANKAMAQVEEAFARCLESRDSFLYAPDSGVIDLAGKVKKYVRSVFKTASPEFKRLNAIRFKKIKPGR